LITPQLSNKLNYKKSGLLLLLIMAIGSYFYFDLGQYLTLDAIKQQQVGLASAFAQKPLFVALGFFLIYVVVTALSIPGALLLTLLGGAIFGLVNGTILVSFASSIGATLAFLASRFLLRDTVQNRFGDKLQAINKGVEKDGAFYLFTLRLIPVFPFFAVNLLMGLTKMKTLTYYWVSQLGMLLGTLVYVNVGTELSKISSLKGLVSPTLILSFAALGLLPWIAKLIVGWINARKVYAGYSKPASFDRNMIVIGGGSAGLVTSYIAAAVKAKVTLVERHKLGGDCLNTGCVPSKALIKTAKLLHQAGKSQKYGIRKMTTEHDFAEVMQRVQRVIQTIEPHDSVERYSSLGVECLEGSAKIISPWQVQITSANGSTQNLSTKNIVIAAGARPLLPPIPGLAEMAPLTSDNVWDLRVQPKRLLVLGGGPIGCELAQAFSRLGSQVTQVEMAPRLMLREDVEVSEYVAKQFLSEGIDVRLNHKAQRFELRDGVKTLIAEASMNGVVSQVEIAFDEVLCALGRIANVTGYGLEEMGIVVTNRKTVEVNEFLQTKYPNIYAAGDVAGPYQFTHTASHMAWYAAVNGLFGKFKRFAVDYSVIPWATFTEPEVARVGLNELEAKEKGIAYEVTHYGIDDLDRAIADESAEGFVKILTVPGKDKILGVTIVGEHAGDLIAEFVLAMRHKLGLNKILGTIHIYPTLAEANKYAAGNWKKAHAPEKLLSYVQRFHAWQRS
jgi:pyruvate/2-oxoglutarate dehydrogenase complex dihydrolipoamide dehydrogenase (E3) component/uncharacterized membrane protein YdjX (TVP38/TMEM64 family)